MEANEADESSRRPDEAPRRFPCHTCGAKVVFRPGTAVLTCDHCGAENEIPQSADEIHELDFRAHLAALTEQCEQAEQQTVSCTACGAETTLAQGRTADACAYCGADVVATTSSRRTIKPASLLPFRITRDQSREAFASWVAGLWFAPNALKRQARIDEGLRGVYVPYWTYDSDTTSWYTGERGEYYYVTETYTVRVGDRTETRTRQKRKTRWYPASGVVWEQFDDVLVLASRNLPRKYADALEPWDLGALVPYQDDYLAGFQAEAYSVELADGFERASEIMDGHIRASVRRDIGGDTQRIHSVRTQHDDVTFKHLLLPIWLSAYRFGGKTYRFLVNGRTGETRGERPYSWVKITLAVLAGLAVIGAIVLLSK